MDLLSALQWADTAFPSGRYTLSHGLEGLVADGIVGKCDHTTLTQVASDMVRHAFGPVDLTAHFCSWRARSVPEIIRIDAHVDAARPTTAARKGSIRVGKQMLFMAAQLGLDDELLAAYTSAVESRAATNRYARGHGPVVMALVHRAGGQDAETAAQIEAYGFIAAIASAAVRLQVTDFIGAQRLIASLRPSVHAAINTAREQSIADIGACTPVLDIAAARHETASARLFIT